MPPFLPFGVSLTVFSPLTITFPDNLPVSGKRHDIVRALQQHQVVIVCGETGSGKTTQLPKIALQMGFGACNYTTGQKPKRIGHTQPRRIAASSVAKRIAQELNTPLGEVVGYKVRFNDTLQKGASVKLMTDGILLAEIQSDPLLQAYDCIIIDEAHERSLNIDFLLGYLKEILPRRPDLKVIVTSATIDVDRFAQHFATGDTPAPVIMVSGRLYPVEIRYQPFEESKDADVNTAIADAVDSLWRSPQHSGDILVFLPGEREIREAADYLRGHLAGSPLGNSTEVLPLFARLSQAEQDRIFAPHSQRRIVLATNVAETSLTVAGIRYVIDSGTARIKRYSLRQKVEQLLLEPISQAAAKQRAGRCGREANGICIRLYDEQDFQARPQFTDPEILRSSLAGVILRMHALRLGDIAQFPFVQTPRPKAITDSYQLLHELGAVDADNQLTSIGKTLSQLPVDPRVGCMLLHAQQRHVLPEVLVIAAALSVQDVRDRPLGKESQADQQHAKFKDERSEFISILKLWQWLRDSKIGKTPALAQAQSNTANNQAVLPVHQRQQANTPKDTTAELSQKLSNRQYEILLRRHYIHVRKFREWRDIHSQLLTVVRQKGWLKNAKPPSFSVNYEALHKSLLAGLLGNIGCKSDTEDWYLGARGIKFYRHPSSRLRKKAARWLMCAELLETTRLFGRVLAHIEPQWLQDVGAHLLKKQVLDPHWEKKNGKVIALERATLYGIVVYRNRRIDFEKIDPVLCRELFIRQALVEGDWESNLSFWKANRKTMRSIETLEHKSRRQDVLVDDELVYAYYDAHIPSHICNAKQLEIWFARTAKTQPKLLHISQNELMRHEAAGITTQQFPPTVRLGGIDCRASYLHKPNDARDGLSVEVPLFALNQIQENRTQWLVPGMLQEKIQALLKSLPQRPRSRLVPLHDTAAAMAETLKQETHFAQGGLLDALLPLVRDMTKLDITRQDFKLDMLPSHLLMHIRVIDENHRQLDAGRNLDALKANLSHQARGAFQALASLQNTLKINNSELKNNDKKENKATQKQAQNIATSNKPSRTPNHDTNTRYTTWSFGELPEIMEIHNKKQTLIGYPALMDHGDAVSISVFDEPELAAQKHRAGLKRLIALQIKDILKLIEKDLPELQKMAIAYMPLGTQDELKNQIIEAAIERAFLTEPLPTNADHFTQRIAEGRSRLNLIAQELARQTSTILGEYSNATRKIKDSKNLTEAAEDAGQQLQRLMPKTFIQQAPATQLKHLPRYLKAITMRLEKAKKDPARDTQKTQELKPLEQRYLRTLAQRKGKPDAQLAAFGWLLEELRVSFFAQELRTPQPVSIKRLEKAWQQLQR